VDDAIDPIAVDLLGLKIEAELFAHYASEEAKADVLQVTALSAPTVLDPSD
jgi:hypothetical protein